jgi:predicted house-cleaning noncanonical NTP pyrophosphatase (MazG superfamily)
MNKKDLKIRGVEPDIVFRLGSLAKQKNISREEYMRQLLESHVQSDVVNFEVNRYEELVKSNLEIIRINTELMGQVRELLDELAYGKIKGGMEGE